MNPFTLVSLLAFLVAIALASLTWFRRPRNVVTKLFALSFVLVAYSSLAEFGYRQADTYETADLWLKAGSFWPLILAALLHFTLAFTGQSKLLKNTLTYVLLYVPAFAFSLVNLTTDLITADIVMTNWGWVNVYAVGFVSDLVAVWSMAIVLWATYLCLRYYFTTTEHSR